MKKIINQLSLRLILLAILATFSFAAVAQDLTVTGKVTTGEKDPLPGASIVVKGTQRGTSTDIDGNYSIKVKEGETLRFISIGFANQEITAKTQIINVDMKPDALSLDEVVVTGLGVKREMKSLGYAMSSIKSEDILKAGVTTSPLTSLYGKAAGVGIQQGAGGPTGGVNIKIRGSARLDKDSKTRPLFVVDGVPIYDKESELSIGDKSAMMGGFDYGSGINDINPEDIESMEILKGAKASVLYGSDGANGVVLITTKKGGETQGLGVQFSYNHTFENPHNYIDFQNEYGTGTNQYSRATTNVNGEEVRRLVTDRWSFGPKFDGSPIMDIDGKMTSYNAHPDNFNDLFKTGSTDNITVAISGGNEKGSMRASYSNFKYNGITDNYWQKKNSFSFSGRMNASKFATFEVNANLFNISTNNRMSDMSQLMSFGLNRDHSMQTIRNFYKTEDGFKRDTEGLTLSRFTTSSMNLLWGQDQNTNRDDKFHLIGSVKGIFQILPYLSVVGTAGLDYTNVEYTTKTQVTQIEPETKGGAYRFRAEKYFIQNYEGSINFDKTFLEKLRVFAMGGGSYRANRDNDISAATYGGLSYSDWFSLNNEKGWPTANEKDKVRGHKRGSDKLYSMYGSTTISWDDTYYIDISARNDWSSTLPTDNNSYFYPGISFTWNFSNNFTIPKLQFGKFRMAWADVGTPATRYFALNNYDLEGIVGTDAYSVKSPGSIMAASLKPERKREFEFGLELKFFPQNRLHFDASFYTNTVYDQIMSVPLSSTTSYGSIKINAGKVNNWGYELLIKGTPIIVKDFRWDMTFTLANQFSKVKELFPGITRKVMESENGYMVTADVGEKMGNLLTYDYLKDESGNRVIGSNGLYQLDNNGGFKKNSNVNPDFIGGFSTDFNYKGINLHLGFDYKFGGTMASMSNYYLLGNGVTKESLQYRDESHGGLGYYMDASNKKIAWGHNQTAPGDSKDGKVYHDGLILPGVQKSGDAYVENDQIISAYDYWGSFNHDMRGDLQPDYIFKNDYIKLREIALSYTVPKNITDKIKLQRLTVSVYGRNLFYLHKTIPNIDPESMLGTNRYFEYSLMPSIRSFGFGVNLNF